MPKVTIDDISRETGLSRGTISRALNDRSDISDATKQRVMAACAKLHYTPSFAARSLATGRNLALAAVMGPLLEWLAVFAVAAMLGVGICARDHPKSCVTDSA